jgi:hypothetical protein
MASAGSEGRITANESADATARVARFLAARAADPSTQLDPFLPPPGHRLRPHVLVELIKADMRMRAYGGQPVRVDLYLGRFLAELPGGRVPVDLVAEEYWLRHAHADRPPLDEYRQRFRDQFTALLAQIEAREVATAGEKDPLGAAPTRVTSVPEHHTIPADHATRSGVTPSSDTLPSLGGYKLLRRIGVGAFGEVYEAEAPGGVKVAVKKILRSVSHPATQSEIESLEATKPLSHPFLLKTVSFFPHEDRLHIVMELADESLADRIKACGEAGEPGLPPEELVPIFEQAAEALDYLHGHGVSHRDIKPQNILLMHGYAKVADFGLARSHEHMLTVVPGQIGTPMYMAPEMWDEKVSLRGSDQYALAVAYVTARLGRPPYMAMPLIELAQAHKYGKPDLGPVPPAEQKVLLKALEKRADRRFPTCAEFAKALRQAVLEKPPAAANRMWATVGVAFLAALLCGLMLVTAVWLLLYKPDGVTQATQKEEPAGPKPLWKADHWAPVAEAERVTLPNGKSYYTRLTRTVAGEPLVAVLVPRERQSDPETFYMLENKITNRVFEAVWDQASGNPETRLHKFVKNNPDKAPGVWRKGAPGGPTTRDGKPLPDLPVVGVTVAEAILVAEELGGLLPLPDQWRKAVGAMDQREPGAGPDVVVPPEDKDDPEKAREFRIKELRGRNLALGLTDGPRPVTELTADLSSVEGHTHKIHQLLSNGREWTRLWAIGNREVRPGEVPAGRGPVYLVGQRWDANAVMTLRDIQELLPAAPWDDTGNDNKTGFRIVLQPE